jgi:hypothetical protein
VILRELHKSTFILIEIPDLETFMQKESQQIDMQMEDMTNDTLSCTVESSQVS